MKAQFSEASQIQTTQETQSGKISSLDSYEDSELALIALTSHPFWLLSGHKVSNPKFNNL